MKDFKQKGIVLNIEFDNQEKLLEYLKEQDEELSTKKFILLSTGEPCQKLYEKASEKIEKNHKIKAVLIYCSKINLNTIWTSKHDKTNHIYTLSNNPIDLSHNIEQVRRNQLP